MMANGKAPLIVNPYGGPGVQYVRDAWGGERQLFDQILVRQGFAVLKVDNRGMANRGKAFAVPIKHHLGPVEFDDQMAAIKQALQQYPQLDGSRMGFWGWSYGGYFTLYTMEKTDAFKAGVSVAPVTDWRNYDSIYTERYMGLPGRQRRWLSQEFSGEFCRRAAWETCWKYTARAMTTCTCRTPFR